MKVPFSPPDISEEEISEVVNTLRSGWITTGPKTKEFERQLSIFSHTNMAACFNSQTAAAEMTLRLLGIGPGDEVIVPAYTYSASCSVVYHVGAKPIIIDCAPNSFEMDYDRVEAAITERTKAIIPVDLGGVICDYDKIFDAVNNKQKLFRPSNRLQEIFGRIIVIADGAHALGAQRNGKVCGEIADFTNFSFHAVKNLTTAEGGCSVWRDIDGHNNKALYNQYMLLSLHGQSKDAFEKTNLGMWEYDIIAPYYKCNMTDIMASIGLAQLKRYPEMLNRRKEIINRYDEVLLPKGIISLKHYTSVYQSSGHLYLARVPGITYRQRSEIIMQMAEYGIACNVHYKPLPMLTAYKNFGFSISDYPNAYKQFENEITLPLHTKLTNDNVEYVLEKLIQSIERIESNNYVSILH